MKKILFSIAVLSIVFFATNFKDVIRGRTEIENLYSIILAGVDKTESNDKNEYLMTTISPATEEEAVKPNNLMVVAGKTEFEANREISMYAENDLFWGHTKYFLIGDEASKDNVFKYLDFLMRDNEPRISISPMVVKDSSARNLVGTLYERNADISQVVESIVSNLNLLSYSSQINLAEVIDLMSQTQDGYLPCLALEKEGKDLNVELGSEETAEGKITEEKNLGEVVYAPGYALIKDGKVIDYLLYEQGRGLNWVINKIVSGAIVVEENGTKYNLEITQGNSKIETKIEDDKLQAEINVNVVTNITEISQQDITMTQDLIKKLETKLGDIVEKEVTETVKIVQKHEIDVIGVGDKFYHHYPVKWEKKYKDQWEELFPQLDIKITVSPTIVRSAVFYESIFFKEGK